MTLKLLSGNQAVGEAVRLAGVDVVSAYPITPQTSIIEHIADTIAEGRLGARFITVESEHSAMAAAIGSSLSGSRTFTATSSQGLALMHELLHWSAGQRCPIVMANVNRALGPPWNVWSDTTDSMSQRDTGWLQVYCETNQEALDATLIAFRVAEDARVQLPVMVMEDAFVLSHTYMPVDVPDAMDVAEFLPDIHMEERIEPRETQVFGSFSPPDLAYMEFRHDIMQSMENAKHVWQEAAEDYGALTGRPPVSAVDEYMTDDADAVLVTMGSLAATARDAVDRLRDEGLKVGLVRIVLFRPFPREVLRQVAARLPVLGVVDRSYSFGGGGPLATEVRAALFGMEDAPDVAGFVAGLGGRDVRPSHLADMLRTLVDGSAPHDDWIGVQEVVP